MELQYYGANAIKFSTKKASLIVDPVSDITNLKVDVKKANILLATQDQFQPTDSSEVFIINGPGEYEFEEFSVKGTAAQAHTAPSGDLSATMYTVYVGGIRILVVGHVNEKLSEEQLESIGVVDAAVIPVGGNGYTLDSVGAANVVRAVEPKLVIPVHAADDGLKYEVPQSEIDLFVKELGAPVAEETVEKLKLKSLPEQMTIQILKKS